MPSVTTVLRVQEKRYLGAWRAKVGRREADRVRDDAAALGTRIHKAAERVMAGRRDEVGADLAPYADAVEAFLDLHVQKVLAVEKRLVSVTQGFGGTLDVYVKLRDGSYAILDWKTSAQLSKQHGHQLAGYALLAREHGMTVNRRIAVKIDKQRPGKFHARSYANHVGDVRVFRACCELWWATERQKKDPLPEWAPAEETA